MWKRLHWLSFTTHLARKSQPVSIARLSPLVDLMAWACNIFVLLWQLTGHSWSQQTVRCSNSNDWSLYKSVPHIICVSFHTFFTHYSFLDILKRLNVLLLFRSKDLAKPSPLQTFRVSYVFMKQWTFPALLQSKERNVSTVNGGIELKHSVAWLCMIHPCSVVLVLSVGEIWLWLNSRTPLNPLWLL